MNEIDFSEGIPNEKSENRISGLLDSTFCHAPTPPLRLVPWAIADLASGYDPVAYVLLE